MGGKRRSSKGRSSRMRTRRGSQRYDPENFDPDYTYVLQDLRQIGLLAGSFLIVLVILSIILS